MEWLMWSIAIIGIICLAGIIYMLLGYKNRDYGEVTKTK